MSDRTTSVESVSSDGIAHETSSPVVGVVPPGYEIVHETAYTAEADGTERMLLGGRPPSESAEESEEATSMRVRFVLQLEHGNRPETLDSPIEHAPGPGDRESNGSLTRNHLLWWRRWV